MFNFSVVINGITFTQDDFEGLEYLNGIPDSLEAMADELQAQAGIPWPTSNTSFNPSFSPPFFPTIVLNLTNSPRIELGVGDFVWVVNSYTNALGAVVTAVGPTSITVQGVHPSSSPNTAANWTVIKTRARLRPYAMPMLGGGLRGAALASRSGLLVGPPSNTLTISTSAIASEIRESDAVSDKIARLGGGWEIEFGTALDGWGPAYHDMKPSMFGGFHIESTLSAVTVRNRTRLAPFKYGAAVFELHTEANGPADRNNVRCGLLSGSEGVWVENTRIGIKLGGLTRTIDKPSRSTPVRFVYSPHTKSLEIWSGSLLDVVTVPDTGIQLECRVESSARSDLLHSDYSHIHFTQQVWR